MKTIEIDGVKYSPHVDVGGDIKICVLDNGFVYIGRVVDSGNMIVLSGARCIIRWGAKQHLGQLADGPLTDTKLGASCVISFYNTRLVHTLEVSQDGWCNSIG